MAFYYLSAKLFQEDLQLRDVQEDLFFIPAVEHFQQFEL